MKLKELADEEETNSFRQRAGRLAKWRELAEQAAAERKSSVKIPSGLENLGIQWQCCLIFQLLKSLSNIIQLYLTWEILGI